MKMNNSAGLRNIDSKAVNLIVVKKLIDKRVNETHLSQAATSCFSKISNH